MRDIFIDKVAAEAHYMAMSHEYTEADYRNDAPPRAFGSETEYTVNITDTAPMVTLANRPYANKLPYYLASSRSFNGIILENGGEIYTELNRLFEYATPECATPDELLVHERAGELIVEDVARALGRHTLMKTAPLVFKRTGYGELHDSTGKELFSRMSTGHHENYSTKIFDKHLNSRTLYNWEPPKEFHELASFLATRPIWAGTGMIEQPSYVISQKRNMISFAQEGNLVKDGEKPPTRFQNGRLEVRSGEGNMSEWAIRTKYALTSLVLRLIEHGEFPESLLIASIDKSASFVAENPDSKIPLLNGEFVTATEHQSRIIDTAYETLSVNNHIHPYEEAAVLEFERFKKDFSNTYMKAGHVEPIADRVDWATKLHHMIENNIPYHDIKGTNMEAIRLDLRYEQLGRNNYARRVQRKLGQQLLQASTIQDALMTPPNTRAARRVKMIKQLKEVSAYTGSDWHEVRGYKGKTFKLGEPL